LLPLFPLLALTVWMVLGPVWTGVDGWLAALPAWVHEYNHHRPHSAIGKHSPITRLNNLAGHHS